MKSKTNIAEITKIALCTALLSACSFIVLPLPVSPALLSLHTLVVNIIGLVMSPCHAACTVGLYLVMGLVGLPVFGGAGAGIDKLFGPTGGFYFGFLLSAVLISLLKGKEIKFSRYLVLTIGFGLCVQHLSAMLFMCFYNGFNVHASFVSVSLPFILWDVIKCVVSSVCAVKLNKIFKQ